MQTYLVIYSKETKIITRFVKLGRNIKIGDINSYHWHVIDVQIFYKISFITIEHYEEIRRQLYKQRIIKVKNREKITNFLDILHNIFN